MGKHNSMQSSPEIFLGTRSSHFIIEKQFCSTNTCLKNVWLFSYNLILNGDAVAADAANFFPFKPVPFARRVSVIVYQQEPESEKHKGYDKKGVFSFEDHLCIVLLKNSMNKKRDT